MKKLIVIAALLASSVVVNAQEIKNLELKRQGDWMSVKMDLDMTGALPGANETVIITPELRHGRYAQALKPVGVYSRNQWYYYQRSGQSASGTDEFAFRKSQVPGVLNYAAMVPYRTWMDGSKLYLVRDSKGCCGGQKEERAENYLAYFQDDTVIDTVYIDRTVVVEKEGRTRSLGGRAFVDFPLSSTTIDVGYHANFAELAQLRASIDSVRSVPGASIKKITIKGYASPEGQYDNNVRLAQDRTQAIKGYVASLYDIPADKFEVETEPENWEGLRSFVDASALPHRAEILEIIDGDRLPDDKEWMIKSRYPADWNVLLRDCLPFLRRTDYRIDYEINN